MDKEAVLVIMLFDKLSNTFNFTSKVGFVEMLYFNANAVLIKQCVDLKSMRTWKVRFWIWSDLQTSGDMRGSVSKFISEKAVILR